MPEKDPFISSSLTAGDGSYSLGPQLAAQASKPPWRPKAAGRIAFFFGPFAGALVVTISLRRMGAPDAAKKVMFLALALAVALAIVLFFVPDQVARAVGLAGEIVFLMLFRVLMEKEFNQWQAAHPDVTPSSGWNAIGWGFLGAFMFIAISFIVAVAMYALFPGRLPAG
jgi:uncharacterized membrane protein